MEWHLGWLAYLRVSLLLVLGSNLLYLGGCWLLARFGYTREQQTYSVGYSGVLFGWMAYQSLLYPGTYTLFGLAIPSWLMPFIWMILISLIVPNASFLVSPSEQLSDA